MGNSFLIGSVLENKFWNYFSDFTYVAYVFLSIIVLTFFLLLLTIVYKKVRRKFPLKVNCWFCNNNTTVPYESSNCWDCPHCKQYNGFDKDGGYNKVIPEQFNHKLNESIFTNLKTSADTSDINSQNNGFCKLCNINQQLKIQQLALFVPLDENNYYEEIEQYREKLEKAYKLCSKCENTLKETLQKQEYNILTNRLNSHRNNTKSIKLSNIDKFHKWHILALVRKNINLALKFTCIIIGILLFLALINYFETENQFLNLALPDFIIIEPVLPVLKVLLNYVENVYSFKRELSFAGLVCWFLVDFDKKVRKNHLCLALWGLLHISFWTPFTGPQLLLCGICLFLSVQASHNKFNYVYKKSFPQKFDYQPVKKVFPNSYGTLNENYFSTDSLSPLLNNDNFARSDEGNDLPENKIKEAERKFATKTESQEKKKKMKKKENEIESLTNEEKEKGESKTPNFSQSVGFSGKSIPSFTDSDKNYGESSGSFNDVYNTLNGLHLGGKQKKSHKPANFLFSNHNFSEIKSSSPIIKPAKLIKNLNSTSWTESNECNSRSSTPSSGYSSQKPEKPELHRYDFPKTMTPLSLNPFGRHNPSHYFEHYDGNHLFYNNMNCFSPGFVPFQQYPGSMGHTTIYTCTRPTNFPFPFSPCPGFPSQKFSPGSARFSDSSDCYNLFQDSSKSFERSKRWCKFKSFLYYFSIFLNIATVMTLFFFIYTGVILVDWKLPKFNLFL